MSAKRSQFARFRWALRLIAALGAVVALAVGVLLWPQAAPPMEFYLDADVNAVAIVRLDTADKGYEAVVQALLAAQMSPEEAAALERVQRLVMDARLLFFLKDGERDVYQTSFLAVTHPRRMAPALRFLAEELLKSEAMAPDRSVEGVEIYPLLVGGWAALTRSAFLFTTDIDWADSVISRQTAGAEGAAPADSAFIRRAQAMGAPHEVRALALMTPHRRGATERLLASLLRAFATLEEEQAAEPFIRELMDNVVFLEVDVDLQAQYRAEITFWFDTTSSVEARDLATRLGNLREALALLLAGAGIEVTNIRLQGQRVVLEGRFQNIAPYLAGLQE